MSFSSFLLPLAFLFILQIVSADTQQSIIGTWTNPSNTTDVAPFCCIPTSITVQSNGTYRYLATFKFPGRFDEGYNAKCSLFFVNFMGTGNMTLYQNTTDNSYLGLGFLGQVVYDFKVKSGPKLNVFIDSDEPLLGCNFTMETFEGSELDSAGAGFVIFFILICGACIWFKNYQKKQSSVLQKEKLVQPRGFNYNQLPSYNPPAGYNPAPNNYYVAPATVKVENTVKPGQEFLQDYPKFI